MSRSRPYQNTFSSGEIDPLLHARSDFQRYQTGLAKCRGFLPLRQGGVTRAPGTIHRGTTRGNAPARMVAFEFAANDALTLEFTAHKMRVWRYGALVESAPGTPFELDTPYGAESLPRLQWVQDKDVVYLADGLQPVQRLSRFALDNWTIAPAPFERGPFRVQNLDEGVTIQASAATGIVTLTGSGDPFAADMVGALLRLEPTDFTTVPRWVGNAGASVGDRVTYDGRIYELSAGSNTGVNPPIHRRGDVRTDADKSTRYRFISDLVGIVRITAVADANSATAEVIRTIPQPCVDDPTYRWSEGAWSDRHGYPACLELYGQRLWAARTPSEPRGIWASAIGDFGDFSPSAEADGALAYTIAATETNNAIQWLRRGRKGIYIGALGEVYRGHSSATGQAIGPTTFETELVAQDGASSARPVSAYGYPIYLTKDRRRVQELRYDFAQDGARPVELSLPSAHLGALGYEQIAWAAAPQRLAFLRTTSGELVVMGYDPEQDVLGWSVVPLAGGVVEDIDVTSAADGARDVVSLIVRREIGGTTVRFREELAEIYGILSGASSIAEAVHLYAAHVLTPDPAADTLSVPHLAGQTVYAWTDRGEHGPLTVAGDGTVTLPVTVSRAVIGLFDESHAFETLDLEAAAPDGSSRGRARRVFPKLGVELHRTAAGRIRAVERDLGQPLRVGAPQELVPLPVVEDLDAFYSGTASVGLVSGHADAVRLRVEPYGGAPLTVLGFSPAVEEAGA